jgi:hypothetical protein
MRTLPALALLLFPLWLGAQSDASPPSPQRPMAQFAAERVAITPVQFWRADTAGWSASADGAKLRAEVDSAIARELRERGMGSRWAYAGDVVRSARRNPTLRSDPSMLGAGRWRSTPPSAGEQVPALVADNLRVVSALGDTRYALIPVELRGTSGLAVLRIVLVDTRRRVVIWYADLAAEGPNGIADALAKRLADLVVDP